MDPHQIEMDTPPTIVASITGTKETRICGREGCGCDYRTCTPQEQKRWQRITNSRNTDGDAKRWMCGPCIIHYLGKPTTHRRGIKDMILTTNLFTDSHRHFYPDETVYIPKEELNDVKRHVANAQKGRGMAVIRKLDRNNDTNY
jgi:hypothetical protein